MSIFNQTFSLSTLPAASTGSFTPLPEGWYTATISNVEEKQTKAGTGAYIAIKYMIDGPTHQGRIVFGNLNLINPNVKAEEIALQQLGEIMRAIKITDLSSMEQLIGKTLSIKLTVRISAEYGDSNDIKGFKAATGSFSSITTLPTKPSAFANAKLPKAIDTETQTSSPSSPPWAR